MKQRIIGCGMEDCGDDAAGLLVVRRLRELGIDASEHNGDGLALMESWQEQEQVILIDSVVTGAPPGTITVWDGRDAPVIGSCVRTSTHAFGIAEALELARLLGRMPAGLRICGIEGRRFDLGSAPSAAVRAAVESLAAIEAARACVHLAIGVWNGYIGRPFGRQLSLTLISP